MIQSMDLADLAAHVPFKIYGLVSPPLWPRTLLDPVIGAPDVIVQLEIEHGTRDTGPWARVGRLRKDLPAQRFGDVLRPGAQIDVLDSLLIELVLLEHPHYSGARLRELAGEIRTRPRDAQIVVDGASCTMELFEDGSAYVAVDRQREIPLYVHACGPTTHELRLEQLPEPAAFLAQPSP